MLQLIAMFILGVIFASCWACIMVHSWQGSNDLTDDEIQEMEKWYRQNYEDDDQ